MLLAKLLALLACRLECWKYVAPQYGVVHTSLIFYSLYIWRKVPCLQRFFMLSFLFPSPFMAVFTAAVFFPGEKNSPAKTTAAVKRIMKRLGDGSDKMKSSASSVAAMKLWLFCCFFSLARANHTSKFKNNSKQIRQLNIYLDTAAENILQKTSQGKLASVHHALGYQMKSGGDSRRPMKTSW